MNKDMSKGWFIHEEEDGNFKKLKSLYTELLFNNLDSSLIDIFLSQEKDNRTSNMWQP